MANPYAQDSQSSFRHPNPKIGGHHNRPPRQHSAYDADGYPVPPGAPANGRHDPNNFAPPPRSEAPPSEAPPRSDTTRGIYEDAAGYNDRPYAPAEPRSHGGNELAPYDEEKAYAQYSDAYGAPDYGYARSQPPPSEPSRAYDERTRAGSRDRRRRRHASPRSTEYDYDSDYDDRTLPPSAPPSEALSRKSGRDKSRTPPKGSKMDILRGNDSDRGLGATLLGGAAGAFLGDNVRKVGGKKGKKGKSSGALQTIAGGVIGAIGAHALERQVDKREQDKNGKADKGGGRKRADSADWSDYGSRGPSRGPPSPVEEFRPRREGRRPPPRRSRSEDSYATGY